MLKAAELYNTIISDWTKKKDSIPWKSSSNSVWTKWIKDRFSDIGYKLEYEVARSKSNKYGEGEYLVDLCWWKEQDNKYWLEMALESEWWPGEDEIDHDFCKLTDIKAYLKIWICSYGNRIIDARKSRMCKNVAKGRFKLQEEEQYLVINLPDPQKEEYKNKLIVDAFWIDSAGKDYPLTSHLIAQ